MKTLYSHQEDMRLAVIDLIDMSELVSMKSADAPPMFLVSRVNTPPAIRGRGLARKLLSEVVEDADTSNAVLLLHPQPYPDTDEQRLLRLYRQFGFEDKADGSMMRLPREVPDEYLLPSQ